MLYRFQKFADECRVPHLRQCFNELADLLSALLSRDLDTLLITITDPITGNTHIEKRSPSLYPYLNTSHLALILDKFVPEAKTISVKPYTSVGGSYVPYLMTTDKESLKELAKKFKKCVANKNNN